MRYFTVEISVVSGVTAQAVFSRDDYNAAMAAYHLFMSSSMSNTDCTEALCMVIDSDGGIYRNERWERNNNE